MPLLVSGIFMSIKKSTLVKVAGEDTGHEEKDEYAFSRPERVKDASDGQRHRKNNNVASSPVRA